MARAGQTISNPLTGEAITFLKTARETDGKLLVFDCRVAAGGIPLPAHAHASQHERLIVISGVLGVMRGGTTHTLVAGQHIVLPARVGHKWWNAGEGEVRFRVDVLRPRRLETALEVVSALARDGRMDPWGIPKDPFELANLVRLSESYVPGVPITLQKLTTAIVSGFGRLLGYDPTFPQYRTSDAVRLAATTPDRDGAA